MDRKLAAILAADVVGYSAMMERDETGTHERLRDGRKDLFEPTIARHHGSIFKLMGDGLLAEFSSVVEAVECAVALQRGLAERNADVPVEQQIRVRIGINLGEVIVEGDDRFGEGVNIAARLEQLAEPGGIWVSAKVAREVEKKLAFGFEPMGAQKVKNITEPVETFRVTLDGRSAPRHPPPKQRWQLMVAGLFVVAALIASAIWRDLPGHPVLLGTPKGVEEPGRIPVIAVLPFQNMSGDPKLEYFSDGVTNDLISMLAGVAELKVVSGSSTFVYKGKPTDVRQIGRDLGVSYVIEGSVWKEPERLRITAQLIDARTGEHVWSEKLDEKGVDPLALQDEVVQRIVATLGGQRGKMYESEYKRVWEKDTPKLEEYDFFLRSNFYFQQFTPESLIKARDVIEEGLKKFPGSSLLSCGLAWDNVLPASSAFDATPEDHWQTAYELEIATLAKPNIGPDAKKSCLWSYMYVQAYRGDFDGALRTAEELAALSPGDAYLIADLSNAYRWNGNIDKAMELIEYSLKNDPVNKDFYLLPKAQVLNDLERYEESAEVISQTGVAFMPAPLVRAINFVHLGKMDEAKKIVAQARIQLPWLTAKRWRDMTFNVNPAIIDRQVTDLVKAGLPGK